MIIKRIYLLILSAIAFCVPYVNATQIMAAGSSLTLAGQMGLLVDLGFENWPGVTLVWARMCYRWIAFALVMGIGLWVDSKDTAHFGVFATAMAALTAWFGWFTTPLLVNGVDTGLINPTSTWGLIILCAVLSVAIYITDSKQKQFGTNSFNDPVIAIISYLMFMQITIALIAGTGIYTTTGDVSTIPTPTVCGGTTYTNCMIDGSSQLTNMADNSAIGGVVNSPFNLIATTLTSGWSALLGVFQLVLALVTFPSAIQTIFPWIASSPSAVILLGMIGTGIWILEILMVARILFKPSLGDLKL